MFMFLWQFLIPLLVFVVVYWKILGVIRHQAKIAADETRRDNEVSNEVGSGGFEGQNRSNTLSRAQINVVQTMVYVSVCFTLCWMPLYFSVLFKKLVVRKTSFQALHVENSQGRIQRVKRDLYHHCTLKGQDSTCDKSPAR